MNAGSEQPCHEKDGPNRCRIDAESISRSKHLASLRTWRVEDEMSSGTGKCPFIWIVCGNNQSENRRAELRQQARNSVEERWTKSIVKKIDGASGCSNNVANRQGSSQNREFKYLNLPKSKVL